MTKLMAPADTTQFHTEHGNHEVDEDGCVTLHSPHDVEMALAHGFRPYEEGMDRPVSDSVKVKELTSERDMLRSQLDRMEARMSALESRPMGAAPGATTPHGSTDARGTFEGSRTTTTPPQGQGTDALGHVEPKKIGDKNVPDFDKLNRDQKVEWLKDVGVSVPRNISDPAALKICQDTVENHEKGLKEAAAARAAALGTSTGATN